ncbi:unnamed protein product [Leuciscus chuanchicus]
MAAIQNLRSMRTIIPIFQPPPPPPSAKSPPARTSTGGKCQNGLRDTCIYYPTAVLLSETTSAALPTTRLEPPRCCLHKPSYPSDAFWAACSDVYVKSAVMFTVQDLILPTVKPDLKLTNQRKIHHDSELITLVRFTLGKTLKHRARSQPYLLDRA